MAINAGKAMCTSSTVEILHLKHLSTWRIKLSTPPMWQSGLLRLCFHLTREDFDGPGRLIAMPAA